MCNQNCNQGRECRLPRCIDDGYDNVGGEIAPDFAKWLDRVCAIAGGILIVLLLAVEWK